MEDVKWIKITVDMFDNRKIRYLRRLPEGDSIVLIWIMLLTLAGRCNAGGMIFLTENIPYTPKMLADELHFEESTVRLAIEALQRLNMVQSDEYLTITGWSEHQNIEGLELIKEQTRKRVERFRERQRAALESGNVTRNVTVTPCNALDIDIDKDKEIYSASSTDAEECTTQKKRTRKRNEVKLTPEQQTLFDRFWEVYPRKQGKKDAVRAWARIDPDEDLTELISKAVKARRSSGDWHGKELEYIPLPATFLNGERWTDETENKPLPYEPDQDEVQKLDEETKAELTRQLEEQRKAWADRFK